MIVLLGTEVIENKLFDFAEESFRQNRMPLSVMPSGKYGYISERPLLMAVVDVTSTNTVKEVDFLCGAAMWYGIDDTLESKGYTFTKTGNATLGNGDVVPQKTYTKGTTICLVQTIDRDVKQVIFKRQAAKAKTKRKKEVNTLLNSKIADALTSAGYLRISKIRCIFAVHSPCNRTRKSFNFLTFNDLSI